MISIIVFHCIPSGENSCLRHSKTTGLLFNRIKWCPYIKSISNIDNTWHIWKKVLDFALGSKPTVVWRRSLGVATFSRIHGHQNGGFDTGNIGLTHEQRIWMVLALSQNGSSSHLNAETHQKREWFILHGFPHVVLLNIVKKQLGGVHSAGFR